MRIPQLNSAIGFFYFLEVPYVQYKDKGERKESIVEATLLDGAPTSWSRKLQKGSNHAGKLILIGKRTILS